MNTFLLIATLAILGFLCFSGPDGFIGPSIATKFARSASLDCLRVQRDIARSPALRGYRFSILSGDTGRFATRSRLPPSGLVAQSSVGLKLQRSIGIFLQGEEQ